MPPDTTPFAALAELDCDALVLRASSSGLGSAGDEFPVLDIPRRLNVHWVTVTFQRHRSFVKLLGFAFASILCAGLAGVVAMAIATPDQTTWLPMITTTPFLVMSAIACGFLWSLWNRRERMPQLSETIRDIQDAISKGHIERRWNRRAYHQEFL